jgi:hypothetical protein
VPNHIDKNLHLVKHTVQGGGMYLADKCDLFKIWAFHSHFPFSSSDSCPAMQHQELSSTQVITDHQYLTQMNFTVEYALQDVKSSGHISQIS